MNLGSGLVDLCPWPRSVLRPVGPGVWVCHHLHMETRTFMGEFPKLRPLILLYSLMSEASGSLGR